MFYKNPEYEQEYIFLNIISNVTEKIILNSDDTNINILNKLCLKLKDNILTEEICAYVNNYSLIGFEYNNIINVDTNYRFYF